jgi:putative Mg2+ transporter-C (MgtC) family protein
MSLHVTWTDIAVRLLLTILAGGLIGVNRSEQARPVGLRTTILVCLAACLAMIEVNLLLATTGKTPDSFVSMDPMRLAHGLLAGMGFIGAGAIVRRGEIVQGVTTAATLWFVTVIGLCFGSGHLALGLVTLLLGFLAVWGLKWVEERTLTQRTATITLITKGEREEELLTGLTAHGYQIRTVEATYVNRTQRRKLVYQVRWRGQTSGKRAAELVRELASRPGIERIIWKPQVP